MKYKDIVEAQKLLSDRSCTATCIFDGSQLVDIDYKLIESNARIVKYFEAEWKRGDK